MVIGSIHAARQARQFYLSCNHHNGNDYLLLLSIDPPLLVYVISGNDNNIILALQLVRVTNI